MLYVLNTELDFVGVIEGYESLIWTSRYASPGDFELYSYVSEKNLNILKRNYYVVRDTDFTHAMIIERIEITTDVDDGNHLIVRGKCLKSILHKRIIISKLSIDNSTTEDYAHRLIDNNAINPTDSLRKISKLMLAEKKGLTGVPQSPNQGDNLGEYIELMCGIHEYGYDVKLDLENKKFVFEMYNGSDRSYSQSENNYVIFSSEYDNLLNSVYSEDYTEQKTAVIVKGTYVTVTISVNMGEHAYTKNLTRSVGTASDLNRCEYFEDIGDGVSVHYTSDGGTEYTSLRLAQQDFDAVATKLLYEHNTIATNAEGEIEPNGTFKYGQHYFLGDVIELETEHGIHIQPRIYEIIESESTTGNTLVVGFGKGDTIA